MLSPAPRQNALKSWPQTLVNLRRLKKPRRQRAQVKARAADQQCQSPARFDVGDCLSGSFSPFDRREVFGRADDVNQVMRYALLLFWRDFGCGDVEAAIAL